MTKDPKKEALVAKFEELVKFLESPLGGPILAAYEGRLSQACLQELTIEEKDLVLQLLRLKRYLKR